MRAARATVQLGFTFGVGETKWVRQRKMMLFYHRFTPLSSKNPKASKEGASKSKATTSTKA